MINESQQEPEARGIVVIKRTRQWADFARSYRIIADGSEVGRIRAGGELQLEFSPGQHVLSARLDWTRSQDLSVVVEADKRIDLEVGSNAKAWLLFAELYLVTFGFREYLYLRRMADGFDLCATDP